MTDAALKALAVALVDGARVCRSPVVSLTRTNAETGKIEDALFWLVDGLILVHPDRWDAFTFVVRRARQMIGVST